MWFVVTSLIAALLAALLIGTAQAEILIRIDKSTQRMMVTQDGEQLYDWAVSTGRTGHATPSGSYTAFRLDADHYSKEWDDAPMPHSIFFTRTGNAIHGSYETKKLGMPASHGCVRLSPANAATLFAMVEKIGVANTKVVLTGSEQEALARRDEVVSRIRRPLNRNAGYEPYYSQHYVNPTPIFPQPDTPYYGRSRQMNPDYGYARQAPYVFR